RQQGAKLAALVVLSDGASNAGLAPLTAAQRLRSLQVPVVAVGFGSEAAGANARDLAVREVVTPPSAFIKNQVDVRATLSVRGYAGEPVAVELLAEGRGEPVATVQIPPSGSREVVAVPGLKFTPLLPGETKLTVRVKPKDGELLRSNNEYSTFITALRGGLRVLYLQGPNFTWEYKFLTRALDPAREIQAELKVIRRPDSGLDAEVVPGRVDVYILGDVAADLLTANQQRLLARAVENGAGLLMLGGRSSFGAGGWARTPLAPSLPVTMGPGDGQIEPEGGLKVVPNFNALDSYILQIGASRSDSARLWAELPPIPGANRLGRPKPAAVVLAEAAGPRPEPLMVSQEFGRGRVLAFGGETWPWARASDETQAAHRKFWRQAILWLAHKEDTGESRVELKLDRRRIAAGQQVGLTAIARDAKDQPIADARYTGTVTFVGPDAKPEPVEIYNQGSEGQGNYFATGAAGEYRVSVSARRGDQQIGTATSRFLVHQDDRELENPAANLALLRQLAELTGGQSLPPEQQVKYLKGLDGKMFTEYSTLAEYRVWDNWPFLLLFIGVLSAEWWLRKRKGWV
ncbi:MAG TPA: glutamine amidotransferase, partial [Isosphaeraceae bacterium]